MIHINRDRVKMPSVLGPSNDSQGKLEYKEARAFYRRSINRRRQLRFPFEAYRHPSVKNTLMDLFSGKCAYCESKIDVVDWAYVEHYRPKDGVVNDQGDYFSDLYWWLANEWSNLLITCRPCNRINIQEGIKSGKGSRFPLMDEKKRASKPGDEDKEEPLLLNPCIDYPEDHLVYINDGRLVSDTIRGQTTIAMLGLNRSELVRARKYAIDDTFILVENAESFLVQARNEKILQDSLKSLHVDIKKFIDDSQEYVGLKRQFLQPTITKMYEMFPDLEEQYVWTTLPLKGNIKTKQANVARSYRSYQRIQADYSLEDDVGKEKYRSQRPFVESLEIHNVKAIKDLNINFTASNINLAPWFMLLGENATGKSTILQAIALVLMGPNYLMNLIRNERFYPADYIRYRTKSGVIKVQLSNFPKPHQLTIRDEKIEYKSPLGDFSTIWYLENKITDSVIQDWAPQTLVFGYGATRLLPHKDNSEIYGGDFGRVDNLFDPFTPLVYAREWLLGLPDDKFDYTALALKELLDLDEMSVLQRDGSQVYLKDNRTKIPLRSFSDGFQSVTALTSDILEVVFQVWPTPEAAHGIVLIDEIGSHLHPTWKMRIVSSLRKFFPGMQFIVTTHQPLCLKGLYDGEVAVLHRNSDNQIEILTELPPIQGLRVDQLLTSEYFGLKSTLDPEIEKKFNEYYWLLSLHTRTSIQNTKLEELKNQLDTLELMGSTRRQRLMLEAIDLSLSRKEDVDLEKISNIEDEVRKTIRKYWSKIELPEDV